VIVTARSSADPESGYDFITKIGFMKPANLGVFGFSVRAKILTLTFLPTALVLMAVAIIIFYAYGQVSQELVINREKEL
jgi:hypothetical protein